MDNEPTRNCASASSSNCCPHFFHLSSCITSSDTTFPMERHQLQCICLHVWCAGQGGLTGPASGVISGTALLQVHLLQTTGNSASVSGRVLLYHKTSPPVTDKAMQDRQISPYQDCKGQIWCHSNFNEVNLALSFTVNPSSAGLLDSSPWTQLTRTVSFSFA